MVTMQQVFDAYNVLKKAGHPLTDRIIVDRDIFFENYGKDYKVTADEPKKNGVYSQLWLEHKTDSDLIIQTLVNVWDDKDYGIDFSKDYPGRIVGDDNEQS